MNPIGGYFELENYYGEEYYPDLLKLNTSRNCFEYILRARSYYKVWLPYYTCDVMLEPINRLGLSYGFYHINDQLEPIIDTKIGKHECIVVNNYFGIKNAMIEELSGKLKNVVVDNSQAFFAKPLPGIDTIYSVRKFFGVPDGGYLSTTEFIDEIYEKDVSFERMNHLLKRIDLGAEAAFEEFVAIDKSMENQPIRQMSNLTNTLLRNINYKRAKMSREKNFHHLHQSLKETNQISIDTDNLCGPMVYPYLVNDDDLRKYLIDNKIFVATYWPNTFDWCTKEMYEYKLVKYLIPLPIDQRYGIDNMRYILHTIDNFKKNAKPQKFI